MAKNSSNSLRYHYIDQVKGLESFPSSQPWHPRYLIYPLSIAQNFSWKILFLQSTTIVFPKFPVKMLATVLKILGKLRKYLYKEVRYG